MGVRRRTLLRLGAASALGVAVPGALAGCESEPVTGKALTSEVPLPEAFTTELPVPPVLRPVSSDATTDYYEITARRGGARIVPGHETEVWGYNGIFPGPTIESRSGRRVVVTHRNELPVPTTVHLHGGHTPPDSDGYPTDVIVRTGDSLPHHKSPHSVMDHGAFDVATGRRQYTYPQDQRAATLWYHDHRMDFTGPQVYKGLAGFHLIRDDEDDELSLPKGDKEIPLMITDRAFDGKGQFRYPSTDPTLRRESGVDDDFMDGVLGDAILVNGAVWPFLEVSNTRYRFRLLNASNARRYELALDPPPVDGPAFVQVGSDGGLLDKPFGHETLPIAQAERFDVVVDFSKYQVGDKVTLINRIGAEGTARVMQFRVTRKERDESRVPERLSDLGVFGELDGDQENPDRDFEFSGGGPWEINKKFFDVNRIDAEPKLGATELWKVRTDKHHPVHLHLVQFKVLNRKGRPPRPTDRGWKDTIDLSPSEDAVVVARWTGYRGKYVFHCHNLEHEDMAMMANIQVV
ncbi:multicopper oxidase domain-containing protein [Asanoa sp. WMMD1127]|uniref:multicopper oxidase family protein n=1 Tax=Asanoa sp. WMMD1127 TaxID=3016107 RepID=UPI002416CDC8|nr:multicopper oxidase domain-containing protein [Asanoa sp. WMMD1127]MDG4820779.1 multicopper oxidase domain-containing protein [Asanoa sp. WMMD1127]